MAIISKIIIVYFYTFQASEAGKYFAIHLVSTTTYYAYSYLSLRVNVAKYKYSFIKDLNYNSSYDIDLYRFPDGKIPYFYQTFIRTEVKKNDNMEIQLTTREKNESSSGFEVDICEYLNKPTESQVYYGDFGAKKCTKDLVNLSDEEKKYKYNYTINENINYTSIKIINKISSLNYLNIYIDSINPSPQPTDDPTPTPSPTSSPSDEPTPSPTSSPSDDQTGTPTTDGNKGSSIIKIILKV